MMLSERDQKLGLVVEYRLISLSDTEKDLMPKRELQRYPTNHLTDLTDDQWKTIALLVTSAPSTRGGRPPEIDLARSSMRSSINIEPAANGGSFHLMFRQ